MIGEPLLIGALWDNAFAWIVTLIMIMTAIGMASRAFTVGALAGYLSFTTIAVETGNQLLLNILYVTLTLILITFGFKLLRVEEVGG